MAKRIKTGAEFREARRKLGLTHVMLSDLWQLGRGGVQRLGDWENDKLKGGLPTIAGLLMEAMLAGFRPRGKKLPVDGRE